MGCLGTKVRRYFLGFIFVLFFLSRVYRGFVVIIGFIFRDFVIWIRVIFFRNAGVKVGDGFGVVEFGLGIIVCRRVGMGFEEIV